MTDLTLMDRAAKAAGIAVRRGTGWQSDMLFVGDGAPNGWVTGREWSPLTDDGDSAKLRRALRIVVRWFPTDVAATHFSDDGRGRSWAEPYGANPAAAERLAVVRAAAALSGDAGGGR